MNRDISIAGASGQEDNLLIRSFLENDTSAFDRLVNKYKDLVFNLCFRMLGDYDDADDCSQETFIKVYANLKSFGFRSSFLTWLYRIAINTCKNRISTAQNRMNKKSVRIDGPVNDGIAPPDISDSSFDPKLLYEKNEQRRHIDTAISSLPENLRILVILRDIEEKSYEDISDITGVTIGTVKSRLARARHILREKLRGIL